MSGKKTHFLFGVDYYPEHWPRERWMKDADLMSKAGFNTVRLAEFAWSKIEPREGEYNFEWLDEAINLLSEKNMKAILGTPTAAPPPWIVKAHPDVLLVDGHGRRAAEGTRKNYCPNNPSYIGYSKKIAEEMALHYGENPNVLGWQIDNEFGSSPCYCENCVKAFREWLRRKYRSLESLNAACGLIFWGQEYGSWDEIFPPRPPLGIQNPALCLEWRRFTSYSWVKYQQIQVDVIRKYAPSQLVTHNFMGLYKELDYFDLAKTLDIVSYDCYPKGGVEVDYAYIAMAHDVMRSLKKEPHWVTELQSGAIKTHMAPIPKPGEIKLWTIQSVARGANATLYFRWRSCRFGAEEYWHGILDHDGIPRRRYFEVKKVSDELKKAAQYIEGTSVKPDIAVTLVYDNLWAIDLELDYGDRNYYGLTSWEPAVDCYRALYARNIPADFVNPISEEISNYKAVFVPSLMLLDKNAAERIKSYVAKGGTLIAAPRTAAKDWNNNIVDEPLPGALSSVFGMTVEEYTGLPGHGTVEVKTVEAKMGGQTLCKGRNWAEMLAPEEAEVAAYYQSGIYKEKPAVTVNSFGEGKAVYIGTFADKEFYLTIVDWLLREKKTTPVLPPAGGFEAVKRTSPDNEIIFALNYNDDTIQIQLDGLELQDLVSDEKISRVLKVGGCDARILKKL